MNSVTVISDLIEWREIRREIKSKRQSVGFVPTMGALHAGHASLIERARTENDLVVVSIYVNPTQFDNPTDLEKYPATLNADKALCESAGANMILLPSYAQIYPDGYRYKVSEIDFATKLCGAHRPGHFDGVLTVVMKLLQLVQPERSYFGEKDFQQLELIRGMSQAFFLDTEIIGCPTVREKDGLAMSSRNVRLSETARERAAFLSKILRVSSSAAEASGALRAVGFTVEYVEDLKSRRLAAVNLDGVRLIDNVEK